MEKTLFVSIIVWLIVCEGQRDSGCAEEETCVGRDTCAFYNSELAKLKKLIRGSSEHRILLNELKGLICNKKKKKVCCRSDPPINSIPNTYTSPNSTASYVPNAKKGECGLSGNAQFILGGVETELGEFPWMVLLRRKRSRNRIWWHCGGTLINQWFVLSAAHCGPTVDKVRVGDYKVVDTNNFDRDQCLFYDNDTERQCQRFRKQCSNVCQFTNEKIDCVEKSGEKICSEEYQDIDVDKHMNHPSYTTTRKGLAIHDIMLIKLRTPVAYNKFVMPICLPDLSYTLLIGEPENRKGFLSFGKVVGWGQTYTNADDEIYTLPTSKQQKLKMPLVSNEECIGKFSDLGLNLEDDISIETHLCAGGEKGKDSCKGDSGGPFIVRRSQLDPYMLIGIVSGGTSRCGIGAPGIFTRVTHYIDWILETMKEA